MTEFIKHNFHNEDLWTLLNKALFRFNYWWSVTEGFYWPNLIQAVWVIWMKYKLNSNTQIVTFPKIYISLVCIKDIGLYMINYIYIFRKSVGQKSGWNLDAPCISISLISNMSLSHIWNVEVLCLCSTSLELNVWQFVHHGDNNLIRIYPENIGHWEGNYPLSVSVLLFSPNRGTTEHAHLKTSHLCNLQVKTINWKYFTLTAAVYF